MSKYKRKKTHTNPVKYKTYFSQELATELKKRGATNSLLIQLAKAIESIPKKPGLKVDTSDNSIAFAGYPVSFVRNHPEKKIYAFTFGEGLNLDLQNGAELMTYFSDNFISSLDQL